MTDLPAAIPSSRLNKFAWQQWEGARRRDSLGISRFPLQHDTCCTVSTASCYHEKAPARIRWCHPAKFFLDDLPASDGPLWSAESITWSRHLQVIGGECSQVHHGSMTSQTRQPWLWSSPPDFRTSTRWRLHRAFPPQSPNIFILGRILLWSKASWGIRQQPKHHGTAMPYSSLTDLRKVPVWFGLNQAEKCFITSRFQDHISTLWRKQDLYSI